MSVVKNDGTTPRGDDMNRLDGRFTAIGGAVGLVVGIAIAVILSNDSSLPWLLENMRQYTSIPVLHFIMWPLVCTKVGLGTGVTVWYLVRGVTWVFRLLIGVNPRAIAT